ncbi:hypothetical protein [Candidatus Viridilinea mediisalina]|uniref:Uncharacterized protein n=1 Tax=Candidatus Viridilinea mediisalina TaxID=2024553 RepID=A0A2A6RQ06_9CHLR|nr:hypothetical protein [Candidatus Viridilinea mediisalina]PDW05107.1 hypothetical protein CJ255_00500 [Candidatus Viridilinea mediisalina]
MDNNTVNQLTDDGFSFAQPGSDITELALLSLKIALESYFFTYSSVKFTISQLENPVDLDQDQIDRLHNSKYRQLYAETIVHFQHFAELASKDLLRSEHALLIVEATNFPVILHKLLKGEEITPSEWENLKSVEFSETLDRIRKLNADARLPPTFSLFAQYDHSLKRLNNLRNRIWHRGTYVLRYKALDRFITGCILPFIVDVTNLPNYASRTNLWKYKALSCGIDPLTELIAHTQNGDYTLGKVAFLKELARAAYRNPIRPVPERGFGRSAIVEGNSLAKQRARKDAEAIARQGDAHALRPCPVCGVESLVLYSEVEIEGDSMAPEAIWSFTNAAVCTCCSFSVDNAIQNPRAYGFDIDDYWFIIE